MANTISTLYYANTFGDMMVAINADSNEINAIGKGNWVKDTGTMYLNGTGVAVQVATNAVIQGQLQVQGVGSSVYVQNNETVGGTLYLTNPVNGLLMSGSANVNGQIFANGAGNSLVVSNNVTIGGNTSISGMLTVASPTTLGSTLAVSGTTNIANTLSVSGNTFTNTLQSNVSVNTATLSVTGNTYSNTIQSNTSVNTATLSVTGQTYTNVLQSNTSINTGTLSVSGTTLTNNLQANTGVNTAVLSVTGQTYTNVLQSNTSINTGTLSVSGTGYLNSIQGNTSVNTATLSVTGQTYTNVLQSNNSINTPTLSVGGTSYLNNIQGNTSVNTATLSVTGQTYTNVLQSNTSINTGTLSVTGTTLTNVLQSNTSINTPTLSVSGISYMNVIQGNTSVNTATLSVTGPSFTNTLQSNTSVNTATLSVTGQTYTNILQSNTSINTGTLSVIGTTLTNNLQANTAVNTATLSVTGQTYTNNLQANTSVNTPTLSVSGTSYLNNIQGNTSVNTATLSVTGQTYTNVLQSNTSINTGALSVSGNIAGSNIVANTTLYSAGVTTLVGKANTISDLGIGGNAYVTGNATITGKTVMAASSNTISDLGIGGNLYVPNTLMMGYSGASANVYNLTVPSGGSMTVYGNFIQSAPTIYSSASFTLYQAPTGIPSGNYATFAVNRLPGANAEIRWDETNKYWGIKDVTSPSNYYKVLTSDLITSSLSNTSVINIASASSANSLNNMVNAAYNKANTGGLFTGDVTVSGNFTVNGTTTTVNSQTVQTNDSLIELASSNPADSLDIGFYGQYVSGTTKYTGLVRTAGGQYTLFQGISANPTTNSIGTITSTNYATLYGNFAGGTGSFSTVSASGTVSSTNSTGVELQALNGAGGFAKMGITNTGSSLGYINATNNFAVQVNGTQAGLFATTGLSVSGNVIASTGLNITGSGGFFNSANKFGIDNNSGTTRMYASGPNSSTRGSYDFRVTDSVGTLDSSAMTLTGSGLTVTNSIISGGGATIGSDIQQSASAGFLYNNGGSPGVVNSGFYLDGAGKNLRFYVNSTEISRFDNYGDLLIGQTSAGYQNSNSIALQPSATGGLVVNHASGSASGSAFANFGYAGASIGTISQNGTTGINLNATGQLQLTGSTVITATVASSDNSTSVATTAFVKNQSYITSSASISGTAYNITQYTVNQNVGTGNNTQFNSVYTTSAITVGQNATNSSVGYNISGPTYGGAIELRTNGVTTDRGWRLGMRDSASGYVAHLTFLDSDGIIKAYNPVSVAGTLSATGNITGANLSGTNTGDQTNISGNAGSVTMSSGRSDTAAYPIVWGVSGTTSQLYSASSCTITSSSGTISATTFSGSGSGLTGTATSLTAGSANAVAWSNVSGKPTALSSFTNDLGNYGGWITGITGSNVTSALGYTPYNATNPAGYITASASITGTAGGVAWSNVSGKPTALSSFTNDLGNYGGWITGITGSNVTSALGYTPYNATNPAGYITASGTATNISAYTINQNVGTSNSPSFVNTTLSGRLLVGNGSAGAPSVAFSSDGGQDTGLYWSADGYTNFTNNGTYSGFVGPGGNMVMTGNITAYGSATAPSDIRLKKNITRIENALDKVCQLGGYTFDRVDRNVARQTGVIAQEVQKVLPEAIFELDDEAKTLTVAYGNMVGLLIEAIKELRVEIEELKKDKK